MRASEKKNEVKVLRRTLLFVITLIGTILLWRGIWEWSVDYITSEQSFLIGAFVLVVVGFFFRKYTLQKLI